MRKLFATLLVTFSIVYSSFGQTKVGGITVPNTMSYQSQELKLNLSLIHI